MKIEWIPLSIDKASHEDLDRAAGLVGVPHLESDDHLRERIRYVAGDSRRLDETRGDALDALAERYGLKRRGS